MQRGYNNLIRAYDNLVKARNKGVTGLDLTIQIIAGKLHDIERNAPRIYTDVKKY